MRLSGLHIGNDQNVQCGWVMAARAWFELLAGTVSVGVRPHASIGHAPKDMKAAKDALKVFCITAEGSGMEWSGTTFTSSANQVVVQMCQGCQ